MRFSFFDILSQWQDIHRDHEWVLGAVVSTSGSVYRKAGAMMLFSDAGHQFGLLSGGCLESDLLIQARKVIALGQSQHLSYDAQDEENIAWRLGIGCGGRADIVLHPCREATDYLCLLDVYHALSEGHAVSYSLDLTTPNAELKPSPKAFEKRVPGETQDNQLRVLLNPVPHLLICGAGVDIVSIVLLAHQMGWCITVVASRVKQSLKTELPNTVRYYGTLEEAKTILAGVDAAVIANHNVERDAAALSALLPYSMRYMGLLGPSHRKSEVLASAGLPDATQIAGPMGLALGGDLPENIALSVLSECHAVLFGSHGKALSSAYL